MEDTNLSLGETAAFCKCHRALEKEQRLPVKVEGGSKQKGKVEEKLITEAPPVAATI